MSETQKPISSGLDRIVSPEGSVIQDRSGMTVFDGGNVVDQTHSCLLGGPPYALPAQNPTLRAATPLFPLRTHVPDYAFPAFFPPAFYNVNDPRLPTSVQASLQ